MKLSLTLALVAGTRRDAHGQDVSGVVRGERDGLAIAGAIVILLGPASEKIAATMSRDDGGYRLVAPSAGRYSLRVDIVGYRSVNVPPFDLATAKPVVRNVDFTFEQVALPTIAVTASSSCDRVAGESGDAARLWSEARKTLEATRIAQDERRFSVALTRFEREIALPDSVVKSSRSFTQSGVSDNPFVSLPPDSIAEHGYRLQVDGRDVYYGPDARVLLSDHFVASHCFGTRRNGPAGTLGLTFRPQRSTGHIEVEGVLWLDSASAELRRLEYRYVPMLGRNGRGGGLVEFGKLPSGLWGVKRWAIRVPVLEVRLSSRRPDGALGRFVDTLVTGVREEGGEVLAGLAAASPAAGTRLRGEVFDSSRNAPLTGAVVTLEGLGRNTRTDEAGRFTLDSLADAGTYTVRFWHPRLDSLGLAMPRATVRVQRGQETVALLAIPGSARIALERCGAAGGTPIRVVTGVVRRGGTAPVAGAEVFVLERAPDPTVDAASAAASLRRLTTLSGESGRYAVCELRPGSVAWVLARADGRWSSPVALTDHATAVARDIELPFAAGAGSVDTSASRTLPIVELGRAETVPDNAIVEGWLLFSDEPPSTPVQVLVDGQLASASVAPGVFHVEHVAEGPRRIAFRVPGVLLADATVRVRHGETSLLLATLERPTPRTVAASARGPRPERWVEGFNQRRQRGQGAFFSRDDIDRRSTRVLADVLRGTPGVRLIPTNSGYRYVSQTSRRFASQVVAGSAQQVVISPTDCEMMFYVDGQPLPADSDIDRRVPMTTVAAIEVYAMPSSVPRQYAGATSGCGVILIWTGR